MKSIDKEQEIPSYLEDKKLGMSTGELIHGILNVITSLLANGLYVYIVLLVVTIEPMFENTLLVVMEIVFKIIMLYYILEGIHERREKFMKNFYL